MPSGLDLNLSHTESIVSPQELLQQQPLSAEQRAFIHNARHTIQEILSQRDDRLLVILGPCSIHDIKSAKEYAMQLKELSNRLSRQFFFIMRVYIEKSRTALGWKGLLYDPTLSNHSDLPTGLAIARRLLIELAALGIPTAAEFLDLSSVYYLSDLICWGCIGARTCSSQLHRQMASGLNMPIGFKNNTYGNSALAVDGAKVAQASHSFIGLNALGQGTILHTKGNPYSHIVLRGGQRGTNFDPASIENALELLRKAHLPEILLIDCSHGNSQKHYQRQVEVFKSVVNQRLNGNRAIRGMLLESHLFAGKQLPSTNQKSLKYGVSITDPCLDWKQTETLLQWAYDQCQNTHSQELYVH